MLLCQMIFLTEFFIFQEVKCNIWKLMNYFYTALNPVVHHFLYPSFFYPMAGKYVWVFWYFSAGANTRLHVCDIFGCMFFKEARIRKAESNNDGLSPLHTSFFVGNTRYSKISMMIVFVLDLNNLCLPAIFQPDNVLNQKRYTRHFMSIRCKIQFFLSLFADAVSCVNTRIPTEVLPVVLGGSVTITCTYNCSDGFVRACWSKTPDNSVCHGIPSRGAVCTNSLHLSNVSAEDLKKRYTCYTQATDDPRLPQKTERVVLLQLEGR